jgi:hypothetical protein
MKKTDAAISRPLAGHLKFYWEEFDLDRRVWAIPGLTIQD